MKQLSASHKKGLLSTATSELKSRDLSVSLAASIVEVMESKGVRFKRAFEIVTGKKLAPMTARKAAKNNPVVQRLSTAQAVKVYRAQSQGDIYRASAEYQRIKALKEAGTDKARRLPPANGYTIVQGHYRAGNVWVSTHYRKIYKK